MKKLIILIIILTQVDLIIYSQEVTTNTNAVGMEHNVLFNAQDRYSVTQTGTATLGLNQMFDGVFLPFTTTTAPSMNEPTEILIENLPNNHTQQGAWVGWSSRVWYPTAFKIEGYETYYGDDNWVTLADYSNGGYSSKSFSIKMTAGRYTKLKFTFYEARGTNGRMQISELFYLHPEATSPYEGLLGSATSSWNSNGNNIYYNEGKVGIETSTPDGNLDVSSTGTPEVFIQSSASSSNDAVLNIRGSRTTSTTSDIAKVIFGSNDVTGGDLAFITARKHTSSTNEGDLLFWTTSSNGSLPSEKMRIDNLGNVGIGTDTPNSKLEVDGDITVNQKLIGKSFTIDLDGGDLSYPKRITSSQVGGGATIELQTFSSANQKLQTRFLLRGAGNNDIEFYDKDENRFVHFDGDTRKVGIGTSTIPAAYTLAVDGKIICEEVKVDMSEDWADFVFEDNYNLMSLKDLDNYIQENKHLPEIPTTAEVEKNGISVGEMNAKLLQKIEELTLYTIEQQEAVDNQNKTIEKQQKVINDLLNRIENLENK